MGPGSQVGGYELVAELARGGIGAVFHARDPRTGRDVALKLLLRGRGAGPVQRRRFEREARALTRLRHPNVVAVLDAGEDEGLPFLAMELVRGESLWRRLQREGPLAPADAVAIVRKLALALAHAHEQGLLHRDVKPQNVLLRQDGEPVLTDFGLTRDLEPEGGTLSRTVGGQVLGTPGYWAPEQALGRHEQVGPRSDVYGLGALLVACLTGSPPQTMSGSTLSELVAEAEKPPTPPSRRRAEVDPALDAICLRALAVDPGERHPDAAALAEALGEWEHGPPPRPRHRTWRVFAAGFAFGALAGSGATLLLAVRRPAATADRLAAASSGTPAAPASQETPLSGSAARELARKEVDAAQAHSEAGRAKPAMEAALRAVALDPGWSVPVTLCAVLHAEQGQHEAALAGFTRALELDPDDKLALLNRAVVLQAMGQAERADADVTRSLELDPRSPRAHVVRGLVRMQRGENALAMDDYDRAVELDPSSGEAYVNRGALRLMEGKDLEGARQDLDLAVKLEPGVLAFTNRAALRERAGDLDGAAQDLERALELDPRNPLAIANRSVILDRRGDLAGALRDLDRAIELEPRYLTALGKRLVLRRRVGDHKGALADADALLVEEPDNPALRAERGMALAGLGDLEEGLAEIDRALEQEPGLFMVRLQRAALRERRGDLRGALQDLEAAGDKGDARTREQRTRLGARLRARLALEEKLERDPDDPALLLERADVRAGAGDLPGAVRDLEQILQRDPHAVAALVLRGAIRYRLEDMDGAMEDFGRVLERAPDDARAWVGHGSVLQLRGDLAGARHDFDRAIELDPRSADAWTNRAGLHLILGDRRSARKDCDRAIELEPRDWRAWANRGAARLDDDPAGAREDLRQALKLGPTSSAEAEQVRAKLAELDAAAPR